MPRPAIYWTDPQHTGRTQISGLHKTFDGPAEQWTDSQRNQPNPDIWIPLAIDIDTAKDIDADTYRQIKLWLIIDIDIAIDIDVDIDMDIGTDIAIDIDISQQVLYSY